MPPLSLPDMRHVETAVSPSRLIQRSTGSRTPEWKIEPDVYHRLMIMCGNVLARCESVLAFIKEGPSRFRKIFTNVVRLTEDACSDIATQIHEIRGKAMGTLVNLHTLLVSETEASKVANEFHSQILFLHYKIDRIGQGNSLPLSACNALEQPPIHEDVLNFMDVM